MFDYFSSILLLIVIVCFVLDMCATISDKMAWLSRWPLTWKTWKSRGISKWSRKIKNIRGNRKQKLLKLWTLFILKKFPSYGWVYFIPGRSTLLPGNSRPSPQAAHGESSGARLGCSRARTYGPRTQTLQLGSAIVQHRRRQGSMTDDGQMNKLSTHNS